MTTPEQTEHQPLRAIFFDLDDTLYDQSFAHAHATRAGQGLDVALRDVSFETYKARASALLEEIHPSVVAGHLTFDSARTRRCELLADEFGGDRSLASAQAAAHINAYRAAERAVPGAAEVLNTLKHAGYPLFIVSNNVRVEQEAKLARLGFAHFFDALIVSGDHPFAKPDPRLFAVALGHAKVAPDHAVHVGDSLSSDVAGAHAAGIHAVWFNRHRRAVPKKMTPPVHVIHDFTECRDAVNVIRSASR